MKTVCRIQQDYTQDWQVDDSQQYYDYVPYQEEPVQDDGNMYDPNADMSQGVY